MNYNIKSYETPEMTEILLEAESVFATSQTGRDTYSPSMSVQNYQKGNSAWL